MNSWTTKELSTRTWPDYEWLFSQGNGWDHCGCVVYQGFRPPREVRKWADKRDWALARKRDLVEQGLTHGILVYDKREPIGWCQFGPASELPIPKRPDSAASKPAKPLWRITCFCVAPSYRQRGVTGVALSAALASIAKAGGGLVRAAPIVALPNDPGLDELIRERGSGQDQYVLAHAREVYGATSVVAYDKRAWSVGGVFIDGLGPAWAYVRPAHLMSSHTGSVSLFKRHRFKPKSLIDPGPVKLPVSALVMERTLCRAFSQPIGQRT
ncbi:MAG TPA: GNAT family N-acetyltransferase [Actinomycetota bacterium]|nr:GNAT family N-acetyltransferase [Actinomycetota bacterium]